MLNVYKDSADLCRKIAEKSESECLLAFSTGKDALCAWVELRKYFTKITPVYYYMAPGLQFIERSLAYYEDFFDNQIVRLPNPNFIRMLNAGVFQPAWSDKIIQKFGFPEITREGLVKWLKEDRKIPDGRYIAIGNRMFDSITRYRSIKRFGPVNEKNKTFYPVYDFKIADVVQSIKLSGAKLPVDYRIWGKTFDGLDYRFIQPLKEHFPDDYQTLKSFFPLIDLEIIRYEKI